MVNHSRARWAGLLLALLFMSALLVLFTDAPTGHAQGGTWPQIELVPRIGGLSKPVYVTSPPGDPSRLFVVEQEGTIRIFQDGSLLSTPFLDIDAKVLNGGERGLLSMAFAPAYADNGHFYVNYTDLSGDTRIERYTVSAADPNLADPNSAELVIEIDQPYSNHNGGQLQFGPDGYLYIGMGDGGGGGDPDENAQDPQELLGKMLRLNVESGDPATYTIPADNPYVGNPDVLDEIWAFGVRNPWRFTFDRATGDLYIADVGQGSWEEINVQPASSDGGENWGWDCYEGDSPYELEDCGPMSDYDFPVMTYNHSAGRCSVTGGYVYRGDAYPSMDGYYFFGDYCSGDIWAAREVGGQWQYDLVADAPGFVFSVGEDAAGRLYVVSGSQVFEVTAPAVYLPLLAR